MTDRFPDYIHPNGQPWLATPRSVPDLPAAGGPVAGDQARSGASHGYSRVLPISGRDRQAGKTGGAPYRQAHPMMAHPVAPVPEPYPTRGTADLKALAVILLIVLVVTVAASLAGVRLS